MGNSEVGHMNIGAGRIVFQDYSRIENAIRDGSFGENAQIHSAVSKATAAGGRIHVMGLLSPGGVHSHDDHFLETVRVVNSLGARNISVP